MQAHAGQAGCGLAQGGAAEGALGSASQHPQGVLHLLHGAAPAAGLAVEGPFPRPCSWGVVWFSLPLPTGTTSGRLRVAPTPALPPSGNSPGWHVACFPLPGEDRGSSGIVLCPSSKLEWLAFHPCTHLGPGSGSLHTLWAGKLVAEAPSMSGCTAPPPGHGLPTLQTSCQKVLYSQRDLLSSCGHPSNARSLHSVPGLSGGRLARPPVKWAR